MIKSILIRLNNKPTYLSLLTLFILTLIYFGLSMYITSLAYKTIINSPEDNPKQYGLEFEEIEFISADSSGLILRGWWIPAKSTNAIIYLHGIDGHRAGHTEVLASFQKMGYSVLTFDLRGHGVSDPSTVGLGVKEVPDVIGAINFLQQEKNIKQVALYGVSYGAVLSILAASEDDRIKGIFIDSPYNKLTDLISSEVPKRTPIPSFVANLLSKGINLSSIILQGINLESIKPAESIKNLNYPVLMVHCMDDERIPIYHSDEINKNSPQDTLYHKFENCKGHSESWKVHETYYLGFAETYFQRIFN